MQSGATPLNILGNVVETEHRQVAAAAA
jgi:hypothetical protein